MGTAARRRRRGTAAAAVAVAPSSSSASRRSGVTPSQWKTLAAVGAKARTETETPGLERKEDNIWHSYRAAKFIRIDCILHVLFVYMKHERVEVLSIGTEKHNRCAITHMRKSVYTLHSEMS